MEQRPVSDIAQVRDGGAASRGVTGQAVMMVSSLVDPRARWPAPAPRNSRRRRRGRGHRPVRAGEFLPRRRSDIRREGPSARARRRRSGRLSRARGSWVEELSTRKPPSPDVPRHADWQPLGWQTQMRARRSARRWRLSSERPGRVSLLGVCPTLLWARGAVDLPAGRHTQPPQPAARVSATADLAHGEAIRPRRLRSVLHQPLAGNEHRYHLARGCCRPRNRTGRALRPACACARTLDWRVDCDAADRRSSTGGSPSGSSERGVRSRSPRSPCTVQYVAELGDDGSVRRRGTH